jgi:hypothetical protein
MILVEPTIEQTFLHQVPTLQDEYSKKENNSPINQGFSNFFAGDP